MQQGVAVMCMCAAISLSAGAEAPAVCADVLPDLSYAATTLRIVKSSLSMLRARHTGWSFAAVSGACYVEIK